MTIQSDAQSSPPRRPNVSDELGKPHVKTGVRRFRWRAVIHSGGKVDPTAGHPSVSWHLADCSALTSPDAHCEVGRRLMALDGNPDGHCQVGDTCPRCDEAAAAVAASQAVQDQVEQALEPTQAALPDVAAPDVATPPTSPDEPPAAPSEMDEPRPAGA
jgi:hypothetical protein